MRREATDRPGNATGIRNFLVSGLSAPIGAIFGKLPGTTLETTRDHIGHFRHGVHFWMATVAVAAVTRFFPRETGDRSRAAAAAGPANSPIKEFSA